MYDHSGLQIPSPHHTYDLVDARSRLMANRLARWVLILFDSSVLSLPIFFAFGWSEAGVRGLGWATLALLVMTGIPLAYLMIGKRRGWVSDFEMSRRAERPRFILVSLSSDVLG